MDFFYSFNKFIESDLFLREQLVFEVKIKKH